eukprot:4510861-Prymnesium_polylepis.3
MGGGPGPLLPLQLDSSVVCVCVNGLRGRGKRSWHACETRERDASGIPRRGIHQAGARPARAAGPLCVPAMSDTPSCMSRRAPV